MSEPGASSARVLVAVTYGLSVRYLHSTGALREIAAVCQPVVGVGWEDQHLTEQLEQDGFEVVALPRAELDYAYVKFRRVMALDHARQLHSPTSRIKRRRQLFDSPSKRVLARNELRRARDLVEVHRPNGSRLLAEREPEAVQTGTNVDDFARFLKAHRIDAVLSVTPYHDQDALLLWAARQQGLPSLTSVISFDNPTTRARMIVRSERVLVWNRYNEEQLVRTYPDLEPADVEIIGAPQFDLHHDPGLVMDEQAWRERLAIPDDRPVILYGAGSAHLIRNEPDLITMIDGLLPSIEGPTPFLLVRRHPNEPPARWAELGQRLSNGAVVDPWAPGSDPMRSWPSRDDLAIQMSSFAHAAVHINVCSSMTLDGAVFDRPQIGPTFVPGLNRMHQSSIRSHYRLEHWQPIAASGGLDTPSTPAELDASIRGALHEPDRLAAGRATMVTELLTYGDGQSSARLARSLRDFLETGG
jgi:hypothetical protein